MSRLTLEEVLAVKYVGDWEWSPSDDWIAFLWDDGGTVDLWLVDAEEKEKVRVSEANDGVSGFAWHPHKDELVFVQDGDLWLAKVKEGKPESERLTKTRVDEVAPGWSPSGDVIAFVREGDLWFYDRRTGVVSQPSVPGRIMGRTFGAGEALNWSSDGGLLCFRFRDEDKRFQLGVCGEDGGLLWRTTLDDGNAGAADWVDEDTLLYYVARHENVIRDYYLYKVADEGESYDQIGVKARLTGEGNHVYREGDLESDKGPRGFASLQVRPEHAQALVLMEEDGWYHHYLLDCDDGSLEQLTQGDWEDIAHAGDSPAWSPGGDCFVYASNREDAVQRHLWVYDMKERESRNLLRFPVTNSRPKFSHEGDKLAFLHGDVDRPVDIWVVEVSEEERVTKGEPQRLTDSLPESWQEEKFSPPEHITYTGAQDWDIDGFLVKPPDFDPQRRYPALVWVHGGPIRQMRGSWHPLRSYALFYAFNQYLAHEGYVTLSINFRGGIGYGRKFRDGLHHKMGVDDVVDVVEAGRYLKGLAYVDEERVGVYGLSYGGYMTLHSLTQYPDVFAMGTNIAGIWDFAQWTRWVASRRGKHGGLFTRFLGGWPEESPEIYAQASPVTFKEGLAEPLINFHGTEDVNVDFEQMDRIVKDCIAMGCEYEAYYYPGEVHTFAERKSWRDAFPKMVREFDRHLKR